MKRLITYLFIAILFCTMSFAKDDLANQILVLKKLNDDGIITDEPILFRKYINSQT